MANTKAQQENGNHINPDEDFILLTGTANPKLAKDIGKLLKKEVWEPISSFADGEIRVRIPQNMRRRHVFIIQSTSSPVNDNIMQLLLMIDAAKRGSASEIIAVIPYYGYSRQDRKEMSRVPISSALIANIIQTAGAHRILTVDIHTEQQEGFINAPWDNVYGSYTFLPAIKEKHIPHLVVASPDKGGLLRATAYARRLQAEGVALVYKERDVNVNNVSEAHEMIGNVKDKNVVLVDDMLDGGGTIVHAAEFIKKRGAASVRAAITHGLFSGDAINKIANSVIEEVIVSDTIAIPKNVEKHPKITVVSVAKLLSEAIKRIQTGDSISKDLIIQ